VNYSIRVRDVLPAWQTNRIDRAGAEMRDAGRLVRIPARSAAESPRSTEAEPRAEIRFGSGIVVEGKSEKNALTLLPLPPSLLAGYSVEIRGSVLAVRAPEPSLAFKGQHSRPLPCTKTVITR